MLGAALIAALLALAVAVTAAGSAVVARHRVQAGADLAALSAAAILPGGAAAACAGASDLALQMRTVLDDCIVDGLDVVVSVEVAVRLGRWGIGSARAVARSGPPDRPVVGPGAR